MLLLCCMHPAAAFQGSLNLTVITLFFADDPDCGQQFDVWWSGTKHNMAYFYNQYNCKFGRSLITRVQTVVHTEKVGTPAVRGGPGRAGMLHSFQMYVQ